MLVLFAGASPGVPECSAPREECGGAQGERYSCRENPEAAQQNFHGGIPPCFFNELIIRVGPNHAGLPCNQYNLI